MTIRIGLIGAGIMGAEHARILSTSVSGATVAVVADADEERAVAVAKAHGAAVIADPDSLIRDDRVDAVLVASPDPTHKSLVLACLATAKPVLCEKPLATATADCVEITKRETEIGRRLVQVGFMRRFDPGYVAMKNAVSTGEFGAALILHCIHRNAEAAPYTTSEAMISNSAIHEIDIARWLLDSEIARITVVTPRPTTTANMQDPQILLFHMANGVVVDVEVFTNAQYGYDVRTEFVCEKGTISLTPPHELTLQRSGMEGFAHHDDWRGRFADAYRIELQAWINTVRGGVPTGASAWDGYAATAVAEAGIKSLRSGQVADVHLEPRPRLYD